MADWEQRLRMYTAQSSSRPRSSSPTPLDSAHSHLRDQVSPTSANGGGSTTTTTRARSPNALERLKASTAMNLVALELRRAAEQQSLSQHQRRASSPVQVPQSPISSRQSAMNPPRELSGWNILPRSTLSDDLQTFATSGGSRTVPTSTPPLPSVHAPRAVSPLSRQYQYDTPAAMTSPPFSTSTRAVQQATPQSVRSSPPRSSNSPPIPSTANNAPQGLGGISASLIADSFNPTTILQMLESKIRTLESTNKTLESSLATLTSKNQQMSRELADAEARVQSALVSQQTLNSLQHEVDRLREELVASNQREERRVEELRRRFVAEIEEERRISGSKEQENNALRGAIRQLASIERSVEH